jgi:hypothetical protein
MTDYNDVGQANALIAEQKQVQTAIDYISNGGHADSVMIAPPVPPPDPENPVPPPTGMPIPAKLNNPNQPELVTALHTALLDRDAAITQELIDLGVTNTPSRS